MTTYDALSDVVRIEWRRKERTAVEMSMELIYYYYYYYYLN
jgi:hypothetical protein